MLRERLAHMRQVLFSTIALIVFTAVTGAVHSESILPDDDRQRLEMIRRPAVASIEPILGEEHSHLLRVPVKTWDFDRPWSVQATLDLPVAIEAGQVFEVQLDARRSDAGDADARGRFTFQHRKGWRNRFTVQLLEPGRNWQRYRFRYRVDEACGAGETELHFAFAYQAQTIDLAGLKVRVLPAGTALDEARPALTYAGREPDAPWREAAQQRIERHRKANLTVHVAHADGRPVSDADVQVEMTRHAFHFGTAVAVDLLLADTPDAERYRRELLANFNYATIENGLKWSGWHSDQRRERTLQASSWLAEQGLTQRGHTMVWNDPREEGLTPEAVADQLAEHIRSQAGHPLLSRVIRDWDLQNEASHNSRAFAAIGVQRLAELFKIAESTSPQINWYINDAKVMSQRVPLHAHHEDFHYRLVEQLLEAGAPVEGIGFQHHHLGHLATPPVEVLRILDRFAAFGLPMQVTEFDIKTIGQWNGEPYPQEQIDAVEADYTRDLLTLMYSHPLVDAFVMWGFWDGRHWKQSAPLFAQDWSLKPSGEAYRELVYGQWWTRESGASDASGRVVVRGHLGTYRVTASSGEDTATQEVQLSRDGTEITLVLP